MLEELFSLVKSSSISTLRSVLNERLPDIQNPLQKHAYKRKKIKTLGTLSLKPYKLFEKSLTKNFAFRKRNKSKILTTGAPLSFNYNNHLTPTHSSETPVVYASLRSVQNKRPPDVLHPFKNTLASKLELWGLCPQTPTSFLKKAWPKTFSFVNGTEWIFD